MTCKFKISLDRAPYRNNWHCFPAVILCLCYRNIHLIQALDKKKLHPFQGHNAVIRTSALVYTIRGWLLFLPDKHNLNPGNSSQSEYWIWHQRWPQMRSFPSFKAAAGPVRGFSCDQVWHSANTKALALSCARFAFLGSPGPLDAKSACVLWACLCTSGWTGMM